MPTPEKKKHKKKDRVRSAWISFVGRITAQLVGAAATVGLGLLMLHRYSGTNAPVHPAEPGPPAITVIFISPDAADAATASPSDAAARQAALARAIARAISNTPPHTD